MASRGMIAIAVASLALGVCAQDSEPPSERPGYEPGDVAALPGWQAEDHVAALSAVVSACAVARAAPPVCRAAAALDFLDETSARDFLEANFRAVRVPASGRLTGYFMPVYEARQAPSDEFSAPVRPRPADLPIQDLSPTARAPYADRAAIEARPAADALAWMRPEDLFFMQIQGSGVLVFPDAERRKAVFAGDNGAPFVGIAGTMRTRGLIADQNGSAGAIRDWLAQHRGPEAQAVMVLDPRYVFFSLIRDDGGDPLGAAGQRLVAGRAVAVDPAWHAMGELLWIDGETPALAGAVPSYRRLTVALDTGGAIKGPARADLYLGRGQAAGQEAGRVRHDLTLYRFVPRDGE